MLAKDPMVEVVAAQGLEEGRGSLGGDERVGGRVRRQGVAAGLKHVGGELMGVGRGGDSEVAEHGVGLPAAQQLNDVGVDVGAEEHGGAAGTQAASAEQAGVYARACYEVACRVAQGGGDGVGRDMALDVVVVERGEGSFGGGVVLAEVSTEPGESFAGAKERIVGGGVANLLASDGVLLVSKTERSPRDAGTVYVIQRHVRGVVDSTGTVKVTSQRRKASDRVSPAVARYSAGRSSQKKPMMHRRIVDRFA